MKMLGVDISANRNEIANLNFPDKVSKIETILNIWRERNLTIFGKVTIIKSLAFSQLVYLLSFFNRYYPKKRSFQSKWNITHSWIFPTKTDRNINFLDVYGLVSAIPHHWRQTLKPTHWVDIAGEIETDKRTQNILDEAKPTYKIKQLLKSKEEKTWENLVKKLSEELQCNLQKDTFVKCFGLLHRILGANKI